MQDAPSVMRTSVSNSYSSFKLWFTFTGSSAQLPWVYCISCLERDRSQWRCHCGQRATFYVHARDPCLPHEGPSGMGHCFG
jgi:hypothetical protein